MIYSEKEIKTFKEILEKEDSNMRSVVYGIVLDWEELYRKNKEMNNVLDHFKAFFDYVKPYTPHDWKLP